MAIEVLGARVHNLKNIDVTIPGHSLAVVTGLSGSGKSSLAFDTIYAEGQRRYIETFSSYARNFLGNLERPDVDKISGLSPVISIEQKTVNHNPRSTVGTTTEIYDFFRLLYARAGEAFSYLSGERMVRFSEDQIIDLILKDYEGRRVYLLAPLVRNRKGHYRELFENLRKKGYLNVRIDGEMREMLHGLQLDRYKNHSIELVVDKMRVESIDEHRLRQSVRLAMRHGEGMMMIMCDDQLKYYSRSMMDPVTGLSYKEPAPHDFSFNSPMGACPHCHGLGTVTMVDRTKIIPDTSLSIAEGGIVPLGKKKKSMIFWQIEALLQTYDCTLDDPISTLPEDAIEAVLSGTGQSYHVSEESMGYSMMTMPYEGLVKYLKDAAGDDASAKERRWAESFSTVQTCPHCHGQRLNNESLHYFIDGKNIAEVSAMTITDLAQWVDQLPAKLNERQKSIAGEILKEIAARIKFLLGVGLGYLSLDRPSMTLSGGESQRIRLATQIGSQLVNVLYILDEPSIGLHQRDNQLLIQSLKKLRDIGNTIIVVEHDRDMMLQSDYLVDIGPGAGRKGGNVVFEGTPDQMLKEHTLTSDYLNGTRRIEVPAVRRKGNGKMLVLVGIGQIDAGECNAAAHPQPKVLPFADRTLALYVNQRIGTYRQGGHCGPVTPGTHTTFEPRHLYGRVPGHQKPLRPTARGTDEGLQARTILVQHRRRSMRSLFGQRIQDHRDELPARRDGALRGMPGQALQSRDAGSALQGKVDCRRTRHDHQPGRGVL